MTNNVNSRSLELSWDPPDLSSAELVITGYTVVCNSSQVGTSVSASTTNLVVNNLMPYTTYTCAVDANFGNNIGQSTPVTETTLEDGKMTRSLCSKLCFFGTGKCYKQLIITDTLQLMYTLHVYIGMVHTTNYVFSQFQEVLHSE